MIKRRNTPAKAAILELLGKTGKALSQDSIEQQMETAMDRATIYRVLNRFCDDGEVHKIIAEDGKQYFALCIKCGEKQTTYDHFHFRCTQCQTVECLSTPVQFALPQGYQLENVNCVLTGICSDCAALKL